MITFATANRIADVPVEWVYQHYLKIKHPLNGQLVKIRSFINSDSTPSLCLFPKNGIYRWKDFSSGEGGSHVDLVITIAKNCGLKLNYIQACRKIVEQYNAYIKEHGIFKPSTVEAELTDYDLKADYEIVEWQDTDTMFWKDRFTLDEDDLCYFNVYPLKWYQLSKQYLTHTQTYKKVEDTNIYGYFTDQGDLYQIYQPYNDNMKFIKLMKYIQGLDQLELGVHKIVIIGASLKDIACCAKLNLPIQFIAPPSESTFLSAEDIEFLKAEFEFVFTLFDNDAAGIRAMKRYKELYDIDYIYIPFEKDTAEIMENCGADVLKYELITRVNKKINK